MWIYTYTFRVFQELYGQDDDSKGETHLPSNQQKAAAHHRMPFSPSSQKSNNAKMVIQVIIILYFKLLLLYLTVRVGGVSNSFL